MAQNVRQAKLFTAEDYVAVYESYINANLKAFDYDTIRTSMVNYIRNNYPENYNDWIESSEFVAILDVIAQLGHNLAFRIDLNSRNNFLSTAERQDSVYKLAEFIGYTPKRNVPAFGEMKIISIKTNEPIIGSEGTSLGGKEIKFESVSNVNNLDDFITVMNSVLQYGNQFGSPKKQITVSNTQIQFYDLNNSFNQIKFDINGIANGAATTFNVVSVDYQNNLVTEKIPNPKNSFGIVYKNSGKGISAADTGFFMYAKEGQLQFKDFAISEPIDNQSLDINVDNINNSDVWVQTINTDGSVVKNWTNVNAGDGYNTAYNNVNSANRDIYSVKSRANNQISVQFPDRTFGNLPKGIIRVWYRTSKDESYVVRPDDIGTKKVTMKYEGEDGNSYSVVFTVQLKQSITNASAKESLDSIKQHAPLAYASQNRLVTANDYNTLLHYQTSGVAKIKSVNRTFSGHSRYVDFNDPTGMYSNLQLFGTDGVIYQDAKTKSYVTSPAHNREHIFNRYLKPVLSDYDLINLYYTRYTNAFNNLRNNIYGYAPVTDPLDENFKQGAFIWNTPGTNLYNANTGFLKLTGEQDVSRVGKSQTNYLNQVRVGALIKFLTTGGRTIWTRVTSIFADGLGIDLTGSQAGQSSGLRANGLGAIALDVDVPSGAMIDLIIPAFNRNFTKREADIIKTFLDSKATFALSYDFQNQSWELINNPIEFSDTMPDEFGAGTWLIYCSYQNNRYTISSRALRYVMSSEQVTFTNINTSFDNDQNTNKRARDTIEITGVVDNNIEVLGKMYVVDSDTDLNGVVNGRKVYLSLIDDNGDARPDVPTVFKDIVGTNQITINDKTVNGRTNVRFEWRHVATENEIVDPSYTNIIDVYVLDKTYDTEFRTWLKTGIGDQPISPTSYEISNKFQAVESKKVISDTVVYKPVKYKILFGNEAAEDLRATFSVVKVKGSNIVDNEIKAEVLSAISEYFDISNWEFGETFYFTELAAYVHKKLSSSISSFVIVPKGPNSVFGRLFEITPNTNEIFIPDVSIDDIDIATTVL